MAFDNQLLAKLFEGVLEDQKVTVGEDLLSAGEVTSALELVPMTLSTCQRDAVINAWCNEISYIQGPPGTGKSHTITAIMLAAVFLGKRVLMVSHKRPAVEIVRRNLGNYLGPRGVICLGPMSEQKRKLRGDIQSWLSDLATVDAPKHLQQKRASRDAQENRVRALLHQVRRMQGQVKDALENERRFFIANEQFLERRNAFEADYPTAAEELLTLPERAGNAELLKRQLDRAQHLVQEIRVEANGYLPRSEWLSLRRLFGFYARNYYADKSRLVPEPTATLYLRELLDVALAYEASTKARLRVSEDFLPQQRRALGRRVAELETEKLRLTKAQFECQVVERLQLARHQVEQFDRLLHWRNPLRITESMAGIDYRTLTATFPLWLGEMRHLGEFLPFVGNLFDLVVVDEASQVNIAEIIPAFYRGSRFCVVGDKKQLGLNAAGLFALNQTFEQLVWFQHFAPHRVTVKQAEERALLVSKNSILDFITSSNGFTVKKAVLKEHFRSLPQLASFTSDEFYQDDGGLQLMTETPQNVCKQCFQKMEVGGQRNAETKVVQSEVDELLQWLKHLIRHYGYEDDQILRPHGFTRQSPPTIGVVSFLASQKNYIQIRLEEEFQDDEIKAHRLMVGTPEDFQGNERNIIFLTMGLDGSSNWSKAHYENPNRFNVATSRAINFTYFIFGGMPPNATLLKRYLRHFGETWKTATPTEESPETANPAVGRFAWRYNPDLCESEFEIQVAQHLHEFIRAHGGPQQLKIYNQVGASNEPGICSCGQKRLDFVLFSERNGACCAVEVDGRDHFCEDGRTYSETHLERIDVLRRAGWKIVHVPYYHWYQRGWLCDRADAQFQRTLHGLFGELRTLLGV